MSDPPLADPHPDPDTARDPSADGILPGAGVELAMVAQASEVLDTLTQPAAPQGTGLSAAERLLAELDAARMDGT